MFSLFKKGFNKSLILSIFAILFAQVGLSKSILANPTEGSTAEDYDKQVEYSGDTDNVYGASYGDYQGEDVHYHLDYIDPVELEERGFWGGLKFWETVPNDMIAGAYTMMNELIVNLSFTFNIMATNVLIFFLNLAFSVNFIDELIYEVEDIVQSVAGVSGGQITSTGMFGGFLTFISLLVAVYTLYQFIVKKAHISSFTALFKSLVAIVIAIVILSNYGNIMTGINNISNEMSAVIVGGNPDVHLSEGDGTLEDVSVVDGMNNTVFNNFVHKPYLYLQYGELIEEDIGQERVSSLLAERPYSEDRNEIVEDEIEGEMSGQESSNTMMTRDGIWNRFSFIPTLFVANGFNAIPLWILTILLFILQIWFVIMAMIAPVALIVGALPNQFGVITRYSIELLIPLFLKMGVSIMALFIFGLTDVMTTVSAQITESTGSGLLMFLVTCFLQALLLLSLFFLRKRIAGIFTKGSEQIGALKDQAQQSFVDPAKKGVQTTTAVGGAIAGGAMGGPQGAMMGYSAGQAVGSTVTGDEQAGQAVRGATTTYMMSEHMNEQEGMKQEKAQKEQEQKEARDNMSNNLSKVNMSDDMKEETVNTLEKEGVNDLSEDEVHEHYDDIASNLDDGSLDKGGFAQEFTNRVKQKRNADKLEREREHIKQTEDKVFNSNDEQDEPSQETNTQNDDLGGESMNNYANNTSQQTEKQQEPRQASSNSSSPSSNVDEKPSPKTEKSASQPNQTSNMSSNEPSQSSNMSSNEPSQSSNMSSNKPATSLNDESNGSEHFSMSDFDPDQQYQTTDFSENMNDSFVENNNETLTDLTPHEEVETDGGLEMDNESLTIRDDDEQDGTNQ